MKLNPYWNAALIVWRSKIKIGGESIVLLSWIPLCGFVFLLLFIVTIFLTLPESLDTYRWQIGRTSLVSLESSQGKRGCQQDSGKLPHLAHTQGTLWYPAGPVPAMQRFIWTWGALATKFRWILQNSASSLLSGGRGRISFLLWLAVLSWAFVRC